MMHAFVLPFYYMSHSMDASSVSQFYSVSFLPCAVHIYDCNSQFPVAQWLSLLFQLSNTGLELACQKSEGNTWAHVYSLLQNWSFFKPAIADSSQIFLNPFHVVIHFIILMYNEFIVLYPEI